MIHDSNIDRQFEKLYAGQTRNVGKVSFKLNEISKVVSDGRIKQSSLISFASHNRFTVLTVNKVEHGMQIVRSDYLPAATYTYTITGEEQ